MYTGIGKPRKAKSGRIHTADSMQYLTLYTADI